MTAFDDVLTANAAYAETFTGADLPAPAAKGLMVVTCMDSRIDPNAALGLSRGDAKVYRNAGGRVTDDVLNTVALSVVLLNVQRVLVLKHTGCAMGGKTEQDVQGVLAGRTGTDLRSLQFGVFPDPEAALATDVQRLRSWPFLPEGLVVSGGVYDVATGTVEITVP